MRYKTFIHLLSMVLLTGVSTSCWDNFEEQYYSTANLKRFYFEQQDTCVGIQYYVFYIDQKKGIVFNADSLPYGRKVDYLLPKMEFYSTNGKVYVNDTLYTDGDTIDFSSPVRFKNTSVDGDYTRTYTVRINVHQVDPTKLVVKDHGTNLPDDSTRNRSFLMNDGSFRVCFPLPNGGISAYQSDPSVSSWSGLSVSGLSAPINIASLQIHKTKWYVTDLSGRLYTSTDGLSWTQQPSNINFVTLLGTLTSKDNDDVNDSYIVGLSKENDGTVYGVRSADGVTWEQGGKLDSDIPVSDYACVKNASVTNRQYLTLMTGLRSDGAFSSSAWATEDGLYWVLVTRKSTVPVSNLKGASLFYYEDKLVCYGGVKSSGINSTGMYVSKDRGKTWIDAPDNWSIPALENGDSYGSVVIQRLEDSVNDKDRFFVWRFGGLTDGRKNRSVWKAYENQAFFVHR